MSSGFQQEMQAMGSDFWQDEDFRVYGRPPPPSRLPRQRGVAGQMIANMRQTGFAPQVAGQIPPIGQPVVQQNAPAQVVAPQVSNQPQGLQPTIIYFDPATGQMTSTAGGQQGQPGQYAAAAPAQAAAPQQPYSFPQYPGMPNISFSQPPAQSAQPTVIPGSAYGGGNVYSSY